MGKYIFASVVIVLLVVIAVLLVRYEMDKTREVMDRSIKEAASTAAKSAANDALGGTPKAAQEAAEAAAEGLGKLAGKFRDGLKPAPAADKPAPTADKDKPVASNPPPETKPDAKPEQPEVKPDATKPAPSTADKKPMPNDGLPIPIPIPEKPTDLIGGIFGAAREASKTVDDLGQDLVTMSVAEERKMGRDAHGAIVKEKKVYDNPKQLSRVKRLAQPLLDQRKRKDIEFNFTLIDEPEVNAFSHLGGFVYLYKGLLDFCGDDDMLQYVLGHEIAHVDLKHCVRGLNYAAKADSVTGGVGGTPVMLVYKLVAAGYSEDQEFASDEWAYKTMRKLGKSHEQTILFSRRFLDFLKSAGKPTGREKPTSIPGAVMQEIDDHFQTHPSAEERLARLERMK
jgi:Zn-dependent protease with chaperone function